MSCELVSETIENDPDEEQDLVDLGGKRWALPVPKRGPFQVVSRCLCGNWRMSDDGFNVPGHERDIAVIHARHRRLQSEHEFEESLPAPPTPEEHEAAKAAAADRGRITVTHTGKPHISVTVSPGEFIVPGSYITRTLGFGELNKWGRST